MIQYTDPAERSTTRYDHITVRLQYRHLDKWRFLQAREWSQQGFNFFSEDTLDSAVLPLKRGLAHFDAHIVWSARPSGDDALLGTLINELVYKRAQQAVNDSTMRARLLRLIRVDGMVPEKRKILASLGLPVSDEKLANLVASRRHDHPLYQYGVRVTSEIWQDQISQALSVSSVLLSMEQWTKSLKGLAPTLAHPVNQEAPPAQKSTNHTLGQ